MQTHTVAPRPYSSHHHYYYFVLIFQMFYGRNKQKNTVQKSRKWSFISASHIVCLRILLISLICCRFNWKWQLLNKYMYRFVFISRLLMITMIITQIKTLLQPYLVIWRSQAIQPIDHLFIRFGCFTFSSALGHFYFYKYIHTIMQQTQR